MIDLNAAWWLIRDAYTKRIITSDQMWNGWNYIDRIELDHGVSITDEEFQNLIAYILLQI